MKTKEKTTVSKRSLNKWVKGIVSSAQEYDKTAALASKRGSYYIAFRDSVKAEVYRDVAAELFALFLTKDK